MEERPIIFNSEMVRAILEGRKTQTRRIVKIDSPSLEFDACNPPWPICGDQYGDAIRVPCPYGQPGDRLWVRETFYCDSPSIACDVMSIGEGLYYKASEENPSIFPKWTPSIHMPRWASRITLEIVNVRVERLNNISEEDAKAEGAEYHLPSAIDGKYYRRPFECLWQSIYGPDSWDKNPFVWVIEFKRV